jgi:hypothetical protein
MTEITQEQIDEIRKVASRNICDCESCRREFDYVFRLAWQKAQDEARKDKLPSVAFMEGVEQERNRIINLIGICKVCKGTHGEWIRKEELIKQIQKDKNDILPHHK